MSKLRKYFNWKRILFYLFIAFLAIQAVPMDRSLPSSNPKGDFLNIVDVPDDVASMIKQACYDCHSNHTRYPWYAKVAPVSWWIQGHIDHGRDELNFSLWDSYSERRKSRKAEESVEFIEEGKMPLSSYTLLHPEAKFNDEEKERLVVFFRSLD